jgi:hypothetical protein
LVTAAQEARDVAAAKALSAQEVTAKAWERAHAAAAAAREGVAAAAAAGEGVAPPPPDGSAADSYMQVHATAVCGDANDGAGTEDGECADAYMQVHATAPTPAPTLAPDAGNQTIGTSTSSSTPDGAYMQVHATPTTADQSDGGADGGGDGAGGAYMLVSPTGGDETAFDEYDEVHPQHEAYMMVAASVGVAPVDAAARQAAGWQDDAAYKEVQDYLQCTDRPLSLAESFGGQ